ALDVLQVPAAKVVHDADLGAPLEERVDQVRADERRATRDQCRPILPVHAPPHVAAYRLASVLFGPSGSLPRGAATGRDDRAPRPATREWGPDGRGRAPPQSRAAAPPRDGADRRRP